MNQIDLKSPSECSTYEIDDFMRLVAEGGEVAVGGLRTRVFTTCIECVIKSRMTGDCHVRFCEQPRGEIPFG